ncbi:hypothetical protein [Luteimonas salinilitoris]|uniref:IS66 family transposase n=1 Tax=Luteimonas salinilitoris TaxID=3237697 RepID=A0ABV4HT54_9GAMM
MKNILEQRLETLASEQQKGREALAELDNQRARLTETLLRIEGAMAVLREMLANESSERNDEPGNDTARRELLRQVSP